MRNRKRLPAVLLGAVLIAGLVPGVALAAPAGDDFAAPTEITALPFRTTLDTTGATKAPDDPSACDSSGEGSVWLRYTAPAAGIVRLAVRSGGNTPLFAIYTGARGALTPLPGICSYFSPFEDTFHVEAGTTYHVLLVNRSAAEAGPVQVGLTTMSPEANDQRASARTLGLPARLEGDTRRATAEPGEAAPSCDPAAVRSVWYRYTPTRTRFISLAAGLTAITVHRANDLAELDCVPGSTPEQAVFRAVQGETYLIRVADRPQHAEKFMLEVTVAAEIAPSFSLLPEPWQPAGTELEFILRSGDRHHSRPLADGTITFGDGSSAPVVQGQRILHRYARSGVYEVTVTASTRDGRSGTASGKVVVK